MKIFPEIYNAITPPVLASCTGPFILPSSKGSRAAGGRKEKYTTSTMRKIGPFGLSFGDRMEFDSKINVGTTVEDVQAENLHKLSIRQGHDSSFSSPSPLSPCHFAQDARN